MHPLEQFMRAIHPQQPVAESMRLSFKAAYQALTSPPTRAGRLEPEEIYLELPKLTFPHLAPAYLMSVRLRDVRPLIGRSERPAATATAMHDDLPIPFAARLMRHHPTAAGLVAAEKDVYYVRYADVAEVDRWLETLFEETAEEALDATLRSYLPGIQIEYIQKSFVPKRFVPDSRLVYRTVVQVQCALHVWYQCLVDQTCIMDRSDCPRGRTHPTQRLSSPDDCCM